MTARLPPAAPGHTLTLLYTADEIRRRIDAMARVLADELPPGELHCVAILQGSFVFVADLARALASRGIALIMDFITLSSYGGGTASSGTITLRHDLALPVAGRHVLVVDDILDTGLTLQSLCRLLVDRGAASIRTCVLIDKPARRRAAVQADTVGFTIGDVFVVGYGLDHGGRYRHLPCLATLAIAPTPPGAPSHA
jgi:hypoxanthine phosphoribosyltransferase